MPRKKDKELKPSGHWQVVPRKSGRVVKVYWTDADGPHGKTLGPAHVRDSGRRTPRDAVIWRAGDGPKPTPEHVTPAEADARLAEILAGAPRVFRDEGERQPTLRMAVIAHVEERRSERGLGRSTIADYDNMAARLYRDLGADRPIESFTFEELKEYFKDFLAESPIGVAKADALRAAGENVAEVVNEAWEAWEPGRAPIEVKTKREAERLAGELGWTWKNRARGVYRVTPPGSGRARRVGRTEAAALEEQGWTVRRKDRAHWVHRTPAAAQTRNKYRDFLSAVLDSAVRWKWLAENPAREVRRSSRKQDRQNILRREDFYDNAQVDRLLAEVEDVFDEAFFLCGFHAGFRLPGEGLGLRWGAADLELGVIRPYDNWVRGALDDTKTATVAPIPLTPRLRAALRRLRERGWRTADDDHVFTRDRLTGHPADEREFRAVFKAAVQRADLHEIPMYNARHSFGTALARRGVDARTIQGLMRHRRISTTEVYMAYSPQADLGEQVARALDSLPARRAVAPWPKTARSEVDELLDALIDELPPKWLEEIHRVRAELLPHSGEEDPGSVQEGSVSAGAPARPS